METIYANHELKSPQSPTSSKRIRSAVWILVILNVLLLAAIIGLTVYCHVFAPHSSAGLSAIEANLTERLQDRENQLNVKLTKITNELESLQCLITQNRTCPEGWKVFGCSCYLFSTLTKTWDESRQDCRDRGAHLVIVDRFGEQEFLTNNIKASTWIGLSDRDNEGIWKWMDGTPLTQEKKQYWADDQPDNFRGVRGFGEDCGQIVSDWEKEKNWNDENCDASRQWICEKKRSSD